jgi:hypothetical protein
VVGDMRHLLDERYRYSGNTFLSSLYIGIRRSVAIRVLHSQSYNSQSLYNSNLLFGPLRRSSGERW